MNDLTDVALFPIPECVSFPGTDYPLHVFEPRYRAMVKHCIETDTLMAICHTQKLVHPAKENQSVEEALHSNQATYKAQPVFSAGPCELKQVLEDGRMVILVHLTRRFQSIEEKQTLPFSIYACKEYMDDPMSEEQQEQAALLQEKILTRLGALTATSPDIHEKLHSDEWLKKPAIDFSFELFGILQMDADIQQGILECQSPVERLERALEMLNQPGL